MNKVIDKVLEINPTKALTLFDFFPLILYSSLGITMFLLGLTWFFGKVWFNTYLEKKIEERNNKEREKTNSNFTETKNSLEVLQDLEEQTKKSVSVLKTDLENLSKEIDLRFVSSGYEDKERLREVVAEVNKNLETKKDSILHSLLSMIEEVRDDIKLIDHQGSRFSLDLAARVRTLEDKNRREK